MTGWFCLAPRQCTAQHSNSAQHSTPAVHGTAYQQYTSSARHSTPAVHSTTHHQCTAHQQCSSAAVCFCVLCFRGGGGRLYSPVLHLVFGIIVITAISISSGQLWLCGHAVPVTAVVLWYF